MAQRQPDNSRSQIMRELGDALTHGLELVIAIGLGVWLGTQAQAKWPGIEPWGLIGGFLIGAGAVWRSVLRWKQQLDRQDAALRDERTEADRD